MQWEDALNMKMEVSIISRIIRHQIIPFNNEDTEREEIVIDMSTEGGDPTSRNAKMLREIIKIWTKFQVEEEPPNPVTYRFIDSPSQDLPMFSYAVLLVLTVCASNHSVCVAIDPSELCYNAFTIRSLLREVVDGCSVLSAFQFITITKEIANQLEHSSSSS